MKCSSILIGVATVAVGTLAGCTRGVMGADPALPLSNTNGTPRILDGDEAQIGLAITNAFKELRYRQMYLVEDPVPRKEVARRFSETNGFVLMPFSGDGSIGRIPMANSNTLPYCAEFYITMRPMSSNQTAVTVRTTRSGVLDGKESGVHGGWANHYRQVPPVRQEEENVLAAIAEEIKKERTSNFPAINEYIAEWRSRSNEFGISQITATKDPERHWVLDDGEAVFARYEQGSLKAIKLVDANNVLIAEITVDGNLTGRHAVTVKGTNEQDLARTEFISSRETDSWSSPNVRFTKYDNMTNNEWMSTRQWWLNETHLLLEEKVFLDSKGVSRGISLRGPGGVAIQPRN